MLKWVSRLWAWIRRHLVRRKEAVLVPATGYSVRRQKWANRVGVAKAVHQDIGKFMKHGRQASWYRKSVKAKVKVEED